MNDNGFSPTPTHTSGAPKTSQYSNSQLDRAKQQVEDVKGIMGQNVQRIIQRGENLEELDKRAENLTANANEFQRTSRTLKRKMWWQNLKMMLILGAITVVIIIVIIVATVGIPSGGGSSEGGASVVPTVAPSPSSSGGGDGGAVAALSISKRSLADGVVEGDAFREHGA